MNFIASDGYYLISFTAYEKEKKCISIDPSIASVLHIFVFCICVCACGDYRKLNGASHFEWLGVEKICFGWIQCCRSKVNGINFLVILLPLFLSLDAVQSWHHTFWKGFAIKRILTQFETASEIIIKDFRRKMMATFMYSPAEHKQYNRERERRELTCRYGQRGDEQKYSVATPKSLCTIIYYLGRFCLFSYMWPKNACGIFLHCVLFHFRFIVSVSFGEVAWALLCSNNISKRFQHIFSFFLSQNESCRILLWFAWNCSKHNYSLALIILCDSIHNFFWKLFCMCMLSPYVNQMT